eukprot:TRINITY_DN37182_c0_g1_i1.p1 TRINITY_DN37182_c0_g1~~TRINITY_DN37182_c0_g1_i1.p1  ORF type:complete len:626 (-),score=153.95 TRINITY_DN37182_c0_g1_i1:18-1895(-)
MAGLPRRTSLHGRHRLLGRLVLVASGLLFALKFDGLRGEQAFCLSAPEARPRRCSLIARSAEAKDAKAGGTTSKSPVEELNKKLIELLGRAPRRNEVLWKYQVTLELPCLENFSTSVGKVSFTSDNDRVSKRRAAAAMLAGLDFDALEAEKQEILGTRPKKKKEKKQKPVDTSVTVSEAQPEETKQEKTSKSKKKKAKAKDANPPKATFEIGQEVEGFVMASQGNGVIVDIGARKAFLPASEIEEGFPKSRPELKSEVKGRILKIKPLTMTLREGSLERAAEAWENIERKPSIMQDLEPLQKIDGVVVGFTFGEAILKVMHPSDPEKVTVASLSQNEFLPGFVDTVKLGDSVKVRVKQIRDKSWVIASMKDKPALDPASLEVGQTLEGVIEGVRWGQIAAAFLDVGADASALLEWQEFGDGFGKGQNDLKVGQTISVRVLKADAKRILVTRRSGSLYRRTLEEKVEENSEAKVAAFQGLAADQWLDASVLRLFRQRALVTVKSPDGATEANGVISKSCFTAAFRKDAAPGLSVRVRLVNPEEPVRNDSSNKGPSRLSLTMLEPDEKVSTSGAEQAEGASEAEDETSESGLEDDAPSTTTTTTTTTATTATEDKGPLGGLSDLLLR